MKKILSFVLVATLAIGCALSASAATWDPTTGTNSDKTSSPQTIPVYGYIGLGDSGGVDVDGDDPENPDVTPGGGSVINVSVPTKILWAAFSTEGSTVTSPDYHITNNSTNVDLGVTLSSFNALNTTATDLETTGTLTLDLTGGMALADVVGHTAYEYSSTFTHGATWNFAVGGSYSGTYTATAKAPTYEMVLAFAAK